MKRKKKQGRRKTGRKEGRKGRKRGKKVGRKKKPVFMRTLLCAWRWSRCFATYLLHLVLRPLHIACLLIDKENEAQSG